MTAAENIFETTRNFLTPDSVRKFSIALDEPREKVEAGLQSVVPTLMNGFINEGSTSEGAEILVSRMEAEILDGTIPNDLNDKNYLTRGEHLAEDIFGNDFHSIASSLTPTTGMNARNVEKLMEMAAPAVLGVIGSKIKNDLNAENLNDFFKGQKNLTSNFEDRKKPPFILVVAGLILVIGTSLWLMSKETLPTSYLKREIASIEKNYTPEATLKASNGLSLKDLTGFLSSATSADLPKRFSMRNITFSPGTTDMRSGGDTEFDMMVTSLKRYPKLTARIEAYIEDTGDADENLLLSENRAMLVREELIGRGIEPSRVKAEGRGPKTDKNQLYFVIQGL